MTAIADALGAIGTELEGRGARFALVGGLAVSVRTEPRFTRDVDVAVSVPSDREAEGLVHSLLTRGWRVLAQVEQEERQRLATARLTPGGHTAPGIVVDLLFASSGIEPEIAEAAERLQALEGLVVPVATVGHLLALKVLAQDERTRPQDRVDARALISVARPADLEQARAGLRLIRERGFHRSKDLLEELDDLLRG